MEDNKATRKWVADLRSGEYKQGQGCLRDDKNRFCCLGVAADGLDLDKWTVNRGEAFADWIWDEEWNTELPSKVRAVFGMTEDEEGDLIDCNDGGDSFDTIADLIEEMAGIA